MHPEHQLLFIQGGGQGVHDEWDDRLVESLRQELGRDHEIRYPRMPAEDDPSYSVWQPALLREFETLPDGAILVAHSVGGTILVRLLAERSPAREFGALFLIAAPFVGAGGWSGEDFEFGPDLGERLPAGMPVHFYHGLDDPFVPPSHVDLFARAIPQALAHRLPGRDHQLNNDLSEVAGAILALGG